MAGKRGGAGRASPRAAKARRADDPAVAAARRAALDGELDETTALRLFLAGGDRGRCGRTCKGNAKRVAKQQQHDGGEAGLGHHAG